MCLLIGDCHGLLDFYKEIIENLEGDGLHSILLGELGFKKQHDWFLKSPLSENNKILFGNHDYFPYLNREHSLGRFKSIPEYNMFTIAGAFSIDWQYRIEGRDLFKEEEMNCQEERKCFDAYCKAKPEIVVSHDAPDSAIVSLFKYPHRFPNGQKTTDFLQRCLEAHQPKTWVFAHHHKDKDETINGTRFICLDELQTIEVEKLI